MKSTEINSYKNNYVHPAMKMLELECDFFIMQQSTPVLGITHAAFDDGSNESFSNEETFGEWD